MKTKMLYCLLGMCFIYNALTAAIKSDVGDDHSPTALTSISLSSLLDDIEAITRERILANMAFQQGFKNGSRTELASVVVSKQSRPVTDSLIQSDTNKYVFINKFIKDIKEVDTSLVGPLYSYVLRLCHKDHGQFETLRRVNNALGALPLTSSAAADKGEISEYHFFNQIVQKLEEVREIIEPMYQFFHREFEYLPGGNILFANGLQQEMESMIQRLWGDTNAKETYCMPVIECANRLQQQLQVYHLDFNKYNTTKDFYIHIAPIVYEIRQIINAGIPSADNLTMLQELSGDI